ncbi:response regulator [Roseomonas nepalensis]|uniref:histidine kinase n=1 Tax=Muricoccus nepalensis TaxID=1854500 RepID=A0A502FJK3_9PROT|nr:response regulator [Roseomonas nepalensis]TPG49293.1 response regulator [Roseomonas nepalensis]
MTPIDLQGADPAALIARVQDLEARLQESEETLGAIRRGEVDALVVGGPVEEQRVYTLESADRPYRVLIEQIQEGAVTLALDGTVLYCNRCLAEMLGVPQERVIGHSLRPLVLPEDQRAFDRLFEDAQHGVARRELTLRTPLGGRVPVYMSLSLLRSEEGVTLLCGVLTDLTEQKLRLRELGEANERLLEEIAERERVEDALRQSQKMEAVGQLTGGLAHDFNNLLTGITGSLELLQTRVAQGRIKDVDRYVNAAQGAAKRAAALTHRLLAFSRRQTLDPKPTDVNRLVAGMEELVRRTMGPAVSVEPVAAGGLWTTLVDPSQLENALLNLCINARDAMPGGGKLVIETGNRWLDERAARERELPPGQYVTLCVSDDGTGMPAEVIARAFDPFFTTKPIGMGTGLGLSMIYGFARQSGGQARIYSEVGQGTMICLYLPRHLGEAVELEVLTKLSEAPRARHDETVLVVDDEPTVRMLVAEILEDLGYTAIEAADGAAGLKVLQSDVRIDLLVTDVGLPGGMNGRQVADAARVARPDLKVLFITGYAENAVLSHGHLEAGMHVLTKPFAMDVLAARIRELIASSSG